MPAGYLSCRTTDCIPGTRRPASSVQFLDTKQSTRLFFLPRCPYRYGMGPLYETPYKGSIKSPEEMLALWRQVEVDIAETGQAYTSPGGVTVTLADIGMVRKQQAYWLNRVMAKRGAAGGRNYADIENAETLT